LSKAVPVLPASMKLRFTKPRLAPCASTALVMTRAWYLPEMAMRPPVPDSSTFTAPPCWLRNSTSSANLRMLGLEGAGGGAAATAVALAVAGGAAGAAGATGAAEASAGGLAGGVVSLAWHALKARTLTITA
jgi:hypothetical protein